MPEQQHYNVVSKYLHWITALIFFGLLFIGFTMTEMDYSENKLAVYALHKSFGLLILILLAMRIIWNFIKPKPKSLKTHTKLEKFFAHAAHIFLYIALLMLPISGWMMSSAGEFTVQFFGLDVPDISQKNEELFNNSRMVHGTFALAVTAVLCAHIAGALKHHFIDKDETLKRMTSRKIEFLGGIIITICIACVFIGIGYSYLPKLKQRAQTEVQTPQAQAESPKIIIQNVPEWEIITELSTLSFTTKQYGQDFSGTFDFNGQIFFDPDNLKDSKALITIDISSIKTGSEDRDKQAKSNEWFDSQSFPIAAFTTDLIERTEDGYIARGILKIRDISKDLDLPFSLKFSEENNESHVQMAGEIELMRLEYNVGQGQWSSTDAIDNMVQIKINLMARLPPE